MIAIKMRFLAGRFHATPWGHHVNEGVVEYPPSLWRFLRSLVATFHRTAPENIDEQSLRRILDALSDPPEFHLPQASVAHTRHYDQANGGVKFFDTFVSLNPKDEIIWIWQDASLEESDSAKLSKLLRNLGTFGRSESWCEVELVENLSEPANSQPVSNGKFVSGKDTIRLLLPNEKGEKLIEILKIETSKMRKDKQLEPNGSLWVTYERDSKILTPRRISPKRRSESKQITVARFVLSSNVLPLATSAMPFAETARFAVSQNRAGNSFSKAFIGKEWNEDLQKWQPLKGHEHAHFFATDEDRDGHLDHLTIYAPCGFNPDDLEALGQIRSVKRPKNLPSTKLVLIGLGKKEDFQKIPIFKKSKTWRSVTPFSLPNFPNRGGGKPPRPKDLPEGQLIKELKSRDLPAPVRIERIDGYETEKRPMMRWLEFHAERLRKDMRGKGLYGFEIEFEKEVEGVIAVGFGCHFGLGLFLPVTQ
jgi:CRISPR-associated protein Csb2